MRVTEAIGGEIQRNHVHKPADRNLAETWHLAADTTKASPHTSETSDVDHKHTCLNTVMNATRNEQFSPFSTQLKVLLFSLSTVVHGIIQVKLVHYFPFVSNSNG